MYQALNKPTDMFGNEKNLDYAPLYWLNPFGDAIVINRLREPHRFINPSLGATLNSPTSAGPEASHAPTRNSCSKATGSRQSSSPYSNETKSSLDCREAKDIYTQTP
jgi:hypothetical protein